MKIQIETRKFADTINFVFFFLTAINGCKYDNVIRFRCCCKAKMKKKNKVEFSQDGNLVRTTETLACD